MRSLGRWLLGAGIAILFAVALAGPLRIGFCDGSAPGWVENRGGCAEWAVWEYLYPWHWGIPDQCLGLCDGSLRP